MLIATGIILAIVVLGWAGKKSVHHSIEIDTPAETVWGVLMDSDSYKEWNPVMNLLEGQITPGTKVKYRFTQSEDNSYEIGSKVKTVEQNRLLNQGGGIPLILNFDHKYILESKGSTTTLTIHEDYGGIGVYFWNPAPVQLAYACLAEAIKARSEKIAK